METLIPNIKAQGWISKTPLFFAIGVGLSLSINPKPDSPELPKPDNHTLFQLHFADQLNRDGVFESELGKSFPKESYMNHKINRALREFHARSGVFWEMIDELSIWIDPATQELYLLVDGYPLSEDACQWLKGMDYEDRNNFMAVRRYLFLKPRYVMAFQNELQSLESQNLISFTLPQKTFIREILLPAMWMHESDFQPHRIGPTLDFGIPQVSPGQAHAYGYTGKLTELNLDQQFQFGIRDFLMGNHYLRNEKFNESELWDLMIIHYNWGLPAMLDTKSGNTMNAQQLVEDQRHPVKKAYLSKVKKKLEWFQSNQNRIDILQGFVNQEIEAQKNLPAKIHMNLIQKTIEDILDYIPLRI